MPQSFQNPTELEPIPDLDSDRVQPGTDRVIEETPTAHNLVYESEGPNHGLDDDNNNDFSEFDEEGEDEFDDDDDEFNESD